MRFHFFVRRSRTRLFNCHTDITIPYDEIGNITVVAEDGTRTDLIKNGRFVLDGTLALNDAFLQEQ